MMADLSRCPSLPCAWCSLTLVDILRPVLSDVYFTAFAGNAVNTSLVLCVLFVLVCLS